PARRERDKQRGNGEHPEDVNPRGHVDRLLVREQLLRWERRDSTTADPCSPTVFVSGHGRRGGGHRWRLPPGKGSAMASTNSTTINPMTTRLATEIWMTPQCT